MPERYQRQVTPQTGAVNPSAGQDSDYLARELESFSNRMNDRLDMDTARRSGQAGESAGAAGDYEERSNYTISGRAFNEAAEVAHQAALQTDIRNSVIQFAIEHPDDPDAFDFKVQGLEEGLKETPAKFRPFVQQRIADYAGRAKLQVLQRQQQKLRAEAMADLERGLDGMVEDAQTAAYEGGDDGLRLTEARRQELNTLLSKGIDAGFIDEGAAEVARENFERGVIVRDTEGIFDRLLEADGLDAGAKAIAGLEKTKPSELGLDVDSYQKMMRTLYSRLNLEKRTRSDQIRMEAAQVAAQKKQMTTYVKDHIALLKKGVPTEQEDSDKTNDYVMQLDDPQLAKDYLFAINLQDNIHNFRRMPAADRAQVLTDLEREIRRGGTVDQQTQRSDHLAAFKAADADVTRQMSEDLRGYANREGFLEDSLLDLANGPDAFAESLSLRTDSGTMGEALTGKPMPLMSEAEAELVSTMYEVAEIGEKLGILGAIARGAEDQALATFALLDEKEAGSMGVLGSFVIEGRTKLAGEILTGQELMDTKQIKKPKPEDYTGDVLREMGTALKGIPQARETYINAIINKYAQLKDKHHDLSEDYDRGLFRQAVQQVVPTAEYNGQRVMVPFGVSQQAFDHWVDNWQDDIGTFYNIVGIDAQSLQERIDDDGYLVELEDGTGRYGITMISDADGDPKPLVRKDGKKLVLEFTR